jgi:hypothetical protein
MVAIDRMDVPLQQQNFIEEMMAAGRGVFAILIGNRQAGDYFSFTYRGLAGAIIAITLSVAVYSGLPTMLGLSAPGDFGRVFLFSAANEALQFGFAAIVLRQLGRMDGFVPFVIASSWATFFANAIIIAITAAGMSAEFLALPLGIVAIVLIANIARLIVKLTALQIAMLIVAQLVSVVVGIVLFGFLLPVFPDIVAEQAGQFAIQRP